MSAGDRLQIVLAAKNEISAELKQTKAEMNDLGRTAAALKKRMDAGEQGLQNEYEQTRRELEKNRLKQIELGRAASKAQTEIRQMTTEGTAGAKRMDRSMGGLNSKMDRTRSASSKLAVGWGKMVGVVAAVTAAIGAASGAFRFLSDSVNEARTARKTMAQMAAVMESMGRTEAPAKIEKMINRLSEISGIDDDALRDMTNTMFTFGNVTGDTFIRANELALDLSQRFGKDLSSSTVMVGKALNDPIRGLTSLTRVGVQFTDQQKEQIKAFTENGEIGKAQKIIMRELSREVGGAAKAQADGLDKTKVAWGNLKEAIGEVLLSLGSGSGIDIAGNIKKATKWIRQHKAEIVAVLQTLISITFKLISVWAKWQSILLKTFGYLFGAMATTLGVLAKLGLVSDGTAAQVKSLADGFGTASKKADETSKFFDKLSRNFKDSADAGQHVKEKLQAIGVEVDNLNRKKVKNLLRDNQIPGVNSQGGTMLAAGGPVLAGTTALVGEIGPELFVPTFGPAKIIGADGPEIRDFHQSGTVIPNHLLHLAAPAVSVSVPPQQQPQAQPLVGTMIVQDGRDAEDALVRAQVRAARLQRERSA